MRKNKSIFQCMKCGGKKMKKGGPTIEEINRGLPMRQPGGSVFGNGADIKGSSNFGVWNSYTNPQTGITAQSIYSEPIRVSEEGNTPDDTHFKVVPFSNKKREVSLRDISQFMSPAFRFAANMFGPSQDGYVSNPLDMQWGQQSIGDTNIAQLGGLIFGPSMEKGGIHIKPENRGKFTAWAKRHGMGVAEAANKVMANKDKYGSSVVKMANFAKNARKWRGQYGGYNFLGQMTKSY